MFDISFFELLVIFVVALLVLGPDKLPGAIRTGALWFGRAKRSFNKVRAEIEQQINADEIRRQLHNESILADIEKARKNADQLVKDTQKQLDKTQDGINKAVSAANTPAVTVVTNSAVEGEPTYETPAPAATDKTEADKTSETSAEPPADDAADPTRNPVADPAPAPVAQDLYNNPPSGRVAARGGKLMPVQPAPASTTESGDS